MTIKDAIFAVESMAHLQGKERELLPIVVAARKEHAVLLEAVELLRHLYEEGERSEHMPRVRAALEKLQ